MSQACGGNKKEPKKSGQLDKDMMDIFLSSRWSKYVSVVKKFEKEFYESLVAQEERGLDQELRERIGMRAFESGPIACYFGRRLLLS